MTNFLCRASKAMQRDSQFEWAWILNGKMPNSNSNYVVCITENRCKAGPQLVLVFIEIIKMMILFRLPPMGKEKSIEIRQKQKFALKLIPIQFEV